MDGPRRHYPIVSVLLGLATMLLPCQASSDELRLSVDPRLGFKVVTVPEDSPVPDVQVQGITELRGMEYGLSMTARGGPLGDTDYIVTALYSPNQTGAFDSIANVDGTALPFSGDVTAERLDIELVLRRQIRDTGLFWFVGLQYTTTDLELESSTPEGEPFDAERESDTYIIKAGVSVVQSITGDGRHRLFASYIPGVGRHSSDIRTRDGQRFTDDGLVLANDINFGYQHIFSAVTSLTVRYRAQIAYLTFDQHDDAVFLQQGFELGLGYTF